LHAIPPELETLRLRQGVIPERIMVRLVVSSLKILVILVSTAVIGLGGVRLFDHYQSEAEAEYGVGEKVVFTVGKNDDVGEVAEKLRQRGLIRSEQAFELTVRYVDRDLQPQSYELIRGMSVATIVDYITTEKSEVVTEVEELQITVVEGWRTEQIAEELDNLGYPPGGDAFLRAVKEYPHDAYDFLEDARKGSLEGFLYPATYKFTNESSPEELVTMMLNAFDQTFSDAMKDRAEQMNLSIYEVVKIAAIIEREAVVSDERPLIADVYLKRFDEGWELEADPTVAYAVGKFEGEWWPELSTSDLEIDSPYNLYQNTGLTPTPICNPRHESMLAVLQPANSPFYLFTARKDGSGRHLFARDPAEQAANQELIESGADLSEYDSAYTEWLLTEESTWISPNRTVAWIRDESFFASG
jgi:UPF0755 protein